MIGGFDILLLGTAFSEDVDVVLRLARAAWPQGVFESGDGETVVDLATALRRRWATSSEFFIYRTREAYDAWTACGLTEKHADDMVSVNVEPDCISFVVSTERSPTHQLVTQMNEALRENRWLALAERAA